MQPTGAQAGSQAIIDARMLTAALLDVSDPDPSALPLRQEASPYHE
jgi:hypothetical protein